jgi:heptosyltransferase-3
LGGTPAQSLSPATLDLSRARRVLLVRVNFRMGNLLLLTPALTPLRHALPRARLDLLCFDGYAALLDNNPDIDRVVTCNRRALRSPRRLAMLVRSLRREQYDVVIDCARGGSFLGAFFVAVSGGQYRVGHAGSRYQRFFNVHVQREGADVKHKVDVLRAFVAGLGIPAESGSLKVVLSDAERSWAAAEWKALGLAAHRPTVGVIVGARGRKQWPRERFLELVERLHGVGELGVVLFAGPEDQAELRALAARVSHQVVVAPALSVRHFAALLSRCALVITGDTGPMHLAAAVQVPTVSVFHATHAIYFAPQGSMHRAVQATSGTADVAQVLAAVADAMATRPACATQEGSES